MQEPVAGGSADAAEWVQIASLGSARGLKGEIYATGAYEAESYLSIGELWLERDGARLNEGRPLRVTEAWAYKGGLVLRFAGLETLEAVEPFENSEALVPRSARPALSAGEYYLADLVGCEVFDRRSGAPLGTVAGWQQYGGPELLEVRAAGPGGEVTFWIPFARSICVEIDPAARRIVVDPPAGLLELNRERGAG